MKHLPKIGHIDVVHSTGPAIHEKCNNTGLLEKFDLRPNQFFLHVGVLEKRKNLTTIVKAMECFSTDYPEIKLVLAGTRGPKSKLDDYNNIEFVKIQKQQTIVNINKVITVISKLLKVIKLMRSTFCINSVSTFNDINKSLTNKSKTKQTFSFSKTPRF